MDAFEDNQERGTVVVVGVGGCGGGVFQLVCGRKVSQKTQRTQKCKEVQKQTLVHVRSDPGGLSAFSPQQTYV